MTGLLVRLSAAVHLAHEADGWVAYGAPGSPRLPLTSEEVLLCLRAAGVSPVEAEPGIDELVRSRVLVPADSPTTDLELRAAWNAKGWCAALDFMIDVCADRDAAVEPPRRRGVDPGPRPRPITDVDPTSPATAPWTRAALRDLLLAADLEAGSAIEVLIGATAIADLPRGWYTADLAHLRGTAAAQDATDSLVAAILDRLAPVAHGRAGFEVQALVLVVGEGRGVIRTGSRDYARMLVRGGSVLSSLEAAASDARVPFRANYAVAGDLGDVLGAGAETVVPIGAIALGARR